MKTDAPTTRVLYVEDEPLARFTGRKVIEALHCTVVEADSCARAAELWQANPFDLVICDHRLGDGLASDLIAALRDSGRQEPVICLSGEAEDIDPDLQTRLGLSAVLKKPLEGETLKEAIARALPKEREPGPSASAGPVAGLEALASPARVPGIWAGPGWHLEICAYSPATATSFEVAAGSDGAAWILLLAGAQAGRTHQATAERIALVFQALARHVPAGATADALREKCRDELLAHIDRDRPWDLHVLRVATGEVAYAGAEGQAFVVVCADTAGRWEVLAPADGRPAPVSALVCMDATHLARSLAGKRIEPTAAARLAARTWETFSGVRDSPSATYPWIQEEGGNAFCLWPRAPQRALCPFHRGQDELWTRSLRQAEAALVSDGCDPFAARVAGCALLELIEHGRADGARVEWTDEALHLRVAGELPVSPALRRLVDSVARAEAGITLTQGRAARTVGPARGAAGPGAAGPADPALAGRFTLVPAPPALLEAELRELDSRHAAAGWLALDLFATRYISPRAVLFLADMAARRREGAGRLCLTNMTPLVERVLRRLGAQHEADLLADPAALQALGRRPTSFSERTSLLAGIPGDDAP
ncbi:MAG: response regulator [Kiritimatiellae bacterium]|nr:response regulator [Kiritimatiellia bacterium]